MVLSISSSPCPINREYSPTSFSSIHTYRYKFHTVIFEFGKKMTSKAFLVLLMFLASVLLISAEVAPKDVDGKLNKKDGNSVHDFSTIVLCYIYYN